jgi:hypothetical protein
MIVVALTIAAALAAMPERPSPAGRSQLVTVAERAAMMKLVGDQLPDAPTARWLWPRLGSAVIRSGVGTYCGWVNAKNRHGGYDGYSPFSVIVAIERGGALDIISVHAAQSDDQPSYEVVADRCAGEGYTRPPG